jgi:acyl-CoA synthetase (AMP-forming)/AMP-acid ligase II
LLRALGRAILALVSPLRTIVDLLESGGTHAPALVAPDGSAPYSYGQLADAVGGVAATLHRANIRRGDRVALAAGDGLQFLLLLFGALAAGAAVAPLNPAYTEPELEVLLRDIAPKLLVLPGEGLLAARGAASAADIAVVDIAADERRAGRDTIANGRRHTEIPGPDDVALLLHTSGTTSAPKHVPLLHRHLVASANTIAEFYDLDRQDVAYCAMPLFHVHGLVATVLATLASGGTVVVPRRFTPRGLLDHLEPHGVTWFSASPTIHTMVVERSAKLPRRAPARPLRFLRSCSSALPEPLRAQLEESFHAPVLEAYGMTEASHQISSNPLPPRRRLGGSVGIPTGTEVAVIDDCGTFLPHDRTGEVVVRGLSVMSGYLNDPEANAAAFVENWFRTGDLGTIDRAGYLRLEGRIKEMVSRGGENVSPYEIEEVLMAHAGVREAACFGIADRKYGEEVVAAVVLGADATVNEVLAHCNERLASYKVPKTLYVVDLIPRTPTGKLQRRRLPALLGIGSEPDRPV